MRNPLFPLLALSLALSAGVRAEAPTYGTLRITAERAAIYHGASLNSKVEDQASRGEEFVLRSDKLHNGFYKIQYGKHVSFVEASKVRLLDGPEPEARPTAKPATPPPPGRAIDERTVPPAPKGGGGSRGEEEREHEGKKEDRIDDGHERKPEKWDERREEEHERKPEGKEDRHEEERERKHEATPVPTLKPREEEPQPTPAFRPTARPREEEAQPTPQPTAKPREEEVQPTPAPQPTAKPRQEEAQPTPQPQPKPTPAPARAEAPAPAPEPTAAPAPTAAPQPRQEGGMVVMKGRSTRPTPVPRPRSAPRPEEVLDRVRRGAAAAAAVGQVVTKVRQAPRQRVERQVEARASAQDSGWTGLGFWRLSLGGGMGKFMTVRPAFKPNPAAGDTRAVESSSFFGLGLEVRPLSFWRFFGDVAGHQHSTQAAALGKFAPAVEVPGLYGAVFPDSDVYYRMDTAAYRLGTRFSLPFDRVEPWVGGAMAWYSWKASYMDAARSLDYGSDTGLAWGLEAHAGVDFKLGDRPRWVFTPFYEYGSQLVAPRITDIGGSGKVWKDREGTWVTAPQRVGLMFGIEW